MSKAFNTKNSRKKLQSSQVNKVFTSLKKSPYVFSSASIAFSRTLRDNVLKPENYNVSIGVNALFYSLQNMTSPLYLCPITKRTMMPFSSSNFLSFSPEQLFRKPNKNSYKFRFYLHWSSWGSSVYLVASMLTGLSHVSYDY